MVETPHLPPAPLACIILAAGQGTRMRSDVPKVLHAIAGMPMIGYVLNACAELLPERITVVTPPGNAEIEKAVLPNRCAIQIKPLGTGDAVRAAHNDMRDSKGDVLVLYGDTPLITGATLRRLQSKKAETGAAIVVAGFRTDEPGAYGRLVLGKGDRVEKIIEKVDASPAEREITLCNGGIMLFSSEKLWPLIDKLKDDNAKKEFYLTGCVALAFAAGDICAFTELPAVELLGINTRSELARAEKLMQARLREQAMREGVTLIDPDTVYLSADTKIGRDVVIGPNVFIAPGVEIGSKVTIRAFCHFEQVRIEDGAVIGPFARLRPGSVIVAGAHIGNFVEIKNTEIGRGAKINHLSYIGDATIGAKANIGAGTITCNYDGFRKFHTHVGAEAFIGSNTALVAPVKVGEGSYVGAGSVITVDVPPYTLAVARGRQANIEGWASRFRDGQVKKD
jgi:bifunctional UDP-N-acetylglucosamine pyrophosphorylase/glucosamine-1-phosphate N-acetyltransferase